MYRHEKNEKILLCENKRDMNFEYCLIKNISLIKLKGIVSNVLCVELRRQKGEPFCLCQEERRKENGNKDGKRLILEKLKCGCVARRPNLHLYIYYLCL